MTAARWNRLTDALAAAGIHAEVDAKPYAASSFGRVRSGVERSVTIHRPGVGAVCVGDQWWSKNPTVWIGYEVWTEGTDDLVKRRWPLTKKCSEVVTAVREALAGAEPS
jgi:hypothetical protein